LLLSKKITNTDFLKKRNTAVRKFIFYIFELVKNDKRSIFTFFFIVASLAYFYPVIKHAKNKLDCEAIAKNYILENKNINIVKSNQLAMLSTNFCNGGNEIYEIENLNNWFKYFFTNKSTAKYYNFINISDLSKKQLETLKEFYIQKKVESMNHQELKQYVLEIISHQINDTIGKEEEMEAWREMSEFFGEQFEIIILDMQTKYIDNKNVLETEIDSQKQRIELLERNNSGQEKKDMWDD